MKIPAIPNDLIGWLVLIGMISLAYFVVRRSDIQGIREANKDLRDRLDDKDKENKELQTQLNELKLELSKFRGILEEKDKRIDALSKVIVGTSPDMVTYMQDNRNFMNQQHEFMVNITKTLTEMNQRSKMIK